MKTKLLGLVVACALLGSTVAANASPYVVTLEQVGSNVDATGSGAIDLVGLSFLINTSGGPGLAPDASIIATGPLAVDDVFAGTFSGPTSFGSGARAAATTGAGDLVAFLGVVRLAVPSGYTSDTPLSDTAIYDTATFASLGVTPGTYVWTWGTGADQSFKLEIGTTPLPAALPLFATGLGAMGLFGWRRKRKASAAIAA